MCRVGLVRTRAADSWRRTKKGAGLEGEGDLEQEHSAGAGATDVIWPCPPSAWKRSLKLVTPSPAGWPSPDASCCRPSSQWQRPVAASEKREPGPPAQSLELAAASRRAQQTPPLLPPVHTATKELSSQARGRAGPAWWVAGGAVVLMRDWVG